MNEKFGEIVRARRRELNLTEKQIADATNISQSYVSHIEKSRKVPSDYVVNKLATVLKYDRDSLRLLAGYAPLGELPTIKVSEHSPEVINLTNELRTLLFSINGKLDVLIQKAA